jgi:hypothetical protein
MTFSSIIDFLMLLLGVSVVRTLLKHFFPKTRDYIPDYLLDGLLIVLFLVGLYISNQSTTQNEQEKKELQAKLNTTQSRLDSITNEKQALELLKRTPPQVNAELRLHESGYFYALVESKNFVPIKFLWDLLLIRTDNQHIELDTSTGHS